MSAGVNSESSLQLNFIPVTFSSVDLAGYTLPYRGPEQLRRLQDENRGKLLARRREDEVQVVALTPFQPSSDWKSKTFMASADWGLFERLLESGARRALRSQYPEIGIPEFGPVRVRTFGEQHDLVREALQQDRLTFAKLNFLHIYRQYTISGTHICLDGDNLLFGLRIHIGTVWRFSASIAELRSKGIDVLGCYAVPLDKGQMQTSIGCRVAGCIRAVEGNKVQLFDYRDQEFVDTSQYTIEGSLSNVARCLETLLGQGSINVQRRIRAAVARHISAEGQIQRIERIRSSAFKQPLNCALGLTAAVSDGLVSNDN